MSSKEVKDCISVPRGMLLAGVSIATVVILLIIVTLLVIICVLVSRLYTFSDAFNAAVNNESACSSDAALCLPYDGTPPAPTEFPVLYSNAVANYTGQLVSNLEVWANSQPGGGVSPSLFGTIASMFQASSAAPTPTDLGLLPGLTLIDTLKTSYDLLPIIGYACYDSVNSVMYLLFRGTQTESEWQADFEVEQLPLPLSIFDPLNGNTALLTGAMVHQGFLTLFLQFVNKLTSIVEGTVEPTLIVAGHSLGAALASLTGLYLASAFPDKFVEVYTFGKPRVGNVIYATGVNTLLPTRFYRLTNDDDTVTNIPLSVTPNVLNYNQPLLYEHEGIPITFSRNVGGIYLNHRMTMYLNFINGLLT